MAKKKTKPVETVSPAANKANNVRTYLKCLRDDPEARKDPQTLQYVSREQDVPIASLRKFVEGDDKAIPAMLITAWNRLLGQDGVITGLPTPSPVETDWYQRTITREFVRVERYHQYEQIDLTRPEASSSLDCWADIVITGGIGDYRRADFEPELITPGARVQSAMRDISDRVNRVLLPPDEKLKIVRDMAKYGDQYEQVGIGYEDGRAVIQRLVNMPVKMMWKKIQKDGSWNPDDAYYQMQPGKPDPVAQWPAWKIVNFSNHKSRADYYGTSIFQTCLRSYVQIEAMEAAMIIRRLERAPLRMKHILDVGHLASEKEIKQARDDYRLSTKKTRTIDQNKNFGIQRINMPADEDWIVAKRTKDSPADISTLEGDAHIALIADYMTFFNKWLSGLGPPKAHLGYEGDTMRSVVTDLHIVFARKGRRMQMQFMHGLHHLFWLQMILDGIDPRKIRYMLIPPSLGTRDELIRAQVLNTHAMTVSSLAKAFAQTGKVPSIRWFLTYIVGLDEETIESLDLVDVLLTTKGSLEQPAGADNTTGQIAGRDSAPNQKESMEMAVAALSNPDIVSEVNKIEFLLGERALKMRKPGLMGIELPEVVNPFGIHFDDVVRSILPAGKRELKDITKG